MLLIYMKTEHIYSIYIPSTNDLWSVLILEPLHTYFTNLMVPKPSNIYLVICANCVHIWVLPLLYVI
jgi:hypothetical protein